MRRGCQMAMVVDSADVCYNAGMNALKIIKIGNSSGVILPREILADLHLEQGDTVAVSRTPDGIVLRAPNEEFDRQMKIAREVMHRRRAALRELAK
jgi:putative addiction module antidote